LVTGSASAGVIYKTSGEDLYRIQSAATSSRVTYLGAEELSIAPEGKGWRFEARARYTRDGPDGKERATARFVQVLQPDGTFEDRTDDDPDFLTILNQPFAVRLDKPTLRDLRTLHGAVPFSATSPLGAQAVLRGYLRPATGGPIGGRPTAAVRFEADGAMTGPLPGYSGMLVSGTMRMDGTAYYALDDATLLALNVALTLDARLSQGRPSVSVPVRIVYRRAIRATASAKTLPPIPLARGGGTVAPATP
jgi:hypothetical protein